MREVNTDVKCAKATSARIFREIVKRDKMHRRLASEHRKRITAVDEVRRTAKQGTELTSSYVRVFAS